MIHYRVLAGFLMRSEIKGWNEKVENKQGYITIVSSIASSISFAYV